MKRHHIEPEVRPSFNELAKHAEVGFARKALGRYLFTRNYERSIRIHEALGTPIIGKVVMGTVGRLNSHPHGGGNYRLNGQKQNKLDAVAGFATGGSVFNEVVHTVCGAPATITVASEWMKHGPELHQPVLGGLAAFNLGLVALQRYNRARTIRTMDRALQRGSEFSPGYENWLGIDSRAVENFREEREPYVDEQLPQLVVKTEHSMQHLTNTLMTQPHDAI